VLDRRTRIDLEVGVLRTAESDRTPSFERIARDQPSSSIAGQNEEEVDASRIDYLGNARPASIPPAGAQRHDPSQVPIGRPRELDGGLDLDPQQPLLDLDHEIEVRRMTGGEQDRRAEPREPLDCRGFAEVALLAAVDCSRPFGGGGVRSIHAVDRTPSSVMRGVQNVPNRSRTCADLPEHEKLALLGDAA
jgi:hypothetical protein